ncbi:caspase family protein [Streptomyces sp. NPDC092370]|uniref:caspase family protein n=1 Tax=Streptomyces sp. NPDC092370 TaxID=3366016 RepID=UPI0038193B8F
MTLVVDRIDSSVPQVHALVIGVGGYRYLPGGQEEVSPALLRLGQLLSPPLSAAAFGDWIETELRHPGAELGSIDLLVSYAPNSDPAHHRDVDMPSTGGVTTAVRQWKRRCDTHPGNVALFFFCGHGLEFGSSYLLMEDYGADVEEAPLEAALDLTHLVKAMRGCQARHQYFLVDACRTTPRSWSLIDLPSGVQPLTFSPTAADRREEVGVLQAAAGGARAWAPAQGRGPTFFTAALLEALRGQAAVYDDESERWHVLFTRVVEAVSGLCVASQVPDARVQGIKPWHLLAGPPRVSVVVRCRPEDAAGQVNPSLKPHDPAAPEPDAWQLLQSSWHTQATAGQHELEVTYRHGGSFMQPPSRSVEIRPPSRTLWADSGEAR